MSRRIVYTIWDDYDVGLLERSRRSAECFGYERHVHFAAGSEGFRHRACWPELLKGTTLFLDTDTEILSNIDFGFDMAEKYGIACCIAPAGMSHYASHNAIKNDYPKGLPQYNCGVVFVGPKGVQTIKRYADLLRKHPGSAGNDQPYFSAAVYDTLNPYILPRNFNYRANNRYEGPLFGPVKIRHAR